MAWHNVPGRPIPDDMPEELKEAVRRAASVIGARALVVERPSGERFYASLPRYCPRCADPMMVEERGPMNPFGGECATTRWFGPHIESRRCYRSCRDEECPAVGIFAVAVALMFLGDLVGKPYLPPFRTVEVAPAGRARSFPKPSRRRARR